jgi:type IV secretory pathway component VirB8
MGYSVFKPRSDLKILGAKTVAWNNFQTADPQILVHLSAVNMVFISNYVWRREYYTVSSLV